ncbi:MAG: LexA-binding, inner rane-associated putative hydrolase [Blastocatellia bacterium]|jgi:membrane-bound metal-dependent hydrolase YbcI (DUF457 family)|nr:LexA-binding, inner rane-associated putative hydrolase [Blastocatellia bacterium]
MPLPVAHGLLGASLVAAVYPQRAKRFWMPLLLGAFLANAADLDFVLAFILNSKTWHRGFSHSLVLALVICLGLLFLFGSRHVREAFAFGLAFASHGILDFLTTKAGGGVELLWPLSLERFGARWVGLSELPSQMPPIEIVESLALEFLLFTPLLLLAIGIRKYVGRNQI